MPVNKPFKSIAALGLGVTLLLTGCASDGDAAKETRPIAKSTDTPKEKSETTPEEKETPKEEPPVVDDTKEIAKVYVTYVDSLYSMDAAKVQGILEAQEAEGTEISDDQARQYTEELAAASPDVWSNVDIASIEDVQDRYSYVGIISSIGALTSEAGSDISLELNESQIVVDGDTASIPPTGVIATVDGEKIEITESDAEGTEDITFIKKDGRWLVQPIGLEELLSTTL